MLRRGGEPARALDGSVCQPLLQRAHSIDPHVSVAGCLKLFFPRFLPMTVQCGLAFDDQHRNTIHRFTTQLLHYVANVQLWPPHSKMKVGALPLDCASNFKKLCCNINGS